MIENKIKSNGAVKKNLDKGLLGMIFYSGFILEVKFLLTQFSKNSILDIF
tara:strand:- start:19141 stop:19290 length:150 start_codon:yes stop_codon:yes gene_type:complete